MSGAPPANTAELDKRYQLLENARGAVLEKPVFDDDPLLEAQQNKWMLYSMAHKGRSPQPKDLNDPAFILLGCFNSRDEAVEHAMRLKKKWTDIDYAVTKLGDWNMLHVDRMAALDQVKIRIEARIDQYHKERDKNFEQLRIAREKKLPSRTGYQKSERDKRRQQKPTQHAAQIGKPVEAPPGKEARTFAEGHGDKLNPSAAQAVRGIPAFSHRFTIQGQVCALVSVIPDTRRPVRTKKKLPEPLIRFYGVFSSKKLAIKWAKERLAPHIGDYDLDTVDMYGWLFPQNISYEDIQEEFRNPEINDILNWQKTETKRAQEFREQCATTGMEADMDFISGKTGFSASMTEDPAAPTASETTPATTATATSETSGPAISETTATESLQSLMQLDCQLDFDQLKAGFQDQLKADQLKAEPLKADFEAADPMDTIAETRGEAAFAIFPTMETTMETTMDAEERRVQAAAERQKLDSNI